MATIIPQYNTTKIDHYIADSSRPREINIMDRKLKPTSEDVYFDVMDAIDSHKSNSTSVGDDDIVLHITKPGYFIKIVRYPQNMRECDRKIYQSRFSTEVKVYRIARHRKMVFVPELYAAGTFNHQGYVYLYLATELFIPIKMSRSQYVLPEKSRKHIYRQMELAIFELHRNGVIHNDIKFDNFVLTSKNYVKIIDFELATIDGVHVECPDIYCRYTVEDRTGASHIITNYMHAVQFRIPLCICSADSDYYALGCSIAAQERTTHTTIIIEGIPIANTPIVNELEAHTILDNHALAADMRKLAECITPNLLSYVCMTNYYSEAEILHVASKIYDADYCYLLRKIFEYNRELILNLVPINSGGYQVLEAIDSLKKKAALPEHMIAFLYLKRRENMSRTAKNLIFGTPNKDNATTIQHVDDLLRSR